MVGVSRMFHRSARWWSQRPGRSVRAFAGIVLVVCRVSGLSPAMARALPLFPGEAESIV